MSTKITKIIQTMMVNLVAIRYVSDIEFVGDEAVRFTLEGKKFDVRGQYPLLTVHQIVGSCLTTSDETRSIETQLNM